MMSRQAIALGRKFPRERVPRLHFLMFRKRHDSWIGRVMRNIILLACASLLGCTDTFHPEYHPVTATTVVQSTNGSTVLMSPGAPVAITPLPAPSGIVIQQPQLADPDAFFAQRR